MAPERVNTACVWTHDAPAPLDGSRARDVRHLIEDATVAEELAVRHADATRGFRSGHYTSQDDYAQSRERCLAALVDAIAATHRVDAADVRAQLHRRPLWSDIAGVFLPAALLFCIAADRVIRRIQRRFAEDERIARLITTSAASIVLTGAAYLAGHVWSLVFEEEIRLRSNHLSYRAFYLPWSRHPIVVVSAGMALFWVIALARQRWPAHDVGGADAMVESRFVSARSPRADRRSSSRAGSSIGRAADS